MGVFSKVLDPSSDTIKKAISDKPSDFFGVIEGFWRLLCKAWILVTFLTEKAHCAAMGFFLLQGTHSRQQVHALQPCLPTLVQLQSEQIFTPRSQNVNE